MPSISPLANQFASTVAQFGLRKEADSHSRFWIWCGICWIGNLGPSTLQTLCDRQFWAKRFILRSSSCIRKLRASRQTRASLNTRKTLSTCKVNRLNSTTTSMARHFQLRFNKVMQAHRRNPQISKSVQVIRRALQHKQLNFLPQRTGSSEAKQTSYVFASPHAHPDLLRAHRT